MTSRKGFLFGIGLAISLLATVAFPGVATVLGVGTIAHSELFNGPATVTVRHLVTPPGEVGGWHYHPGYVFNVVTSGTVNVEDGCGLDEAFTAGEAFEKIGGRVHRAKNLGGIDAVEFNTFILPEGSPLAVPVPERLCGPPRAVNECTAGGWETFTHPRMFANLGDCVNFVRRGE